MVHYIEEVQGWTHLKRLAGLPDVSAPGALVIPFQLSVVKIFRASFPSHPAIKQTKTIYFPAYLIHILEFKISTLSTKKNNVRGISLSDNQLTENNYQKKKIRKVFIFIYLSLFYSR